MAVENIFNSSFFGKILYIGEKNYLIDRKEGIRELEPDDVGKARAVVLDKRYYFEVVSKFPFSNIKDIQASIRTDLASYCPFDADRLVVRKVVTSGDQTKVNIWFIDPRVEALLKKTSPIWIFPETAVLAFANHDKRQSLFSVRRGDAERLLVHIDHDRAVRSMIASQGGIDLDRFRRSVGREAKDCAVETYETPEDYFRYIQATLLNAKLNHLVPCLNSKAYVKQVNLSQVKKGAAAALAMVILYLSFATLLPLMAQRRLNQKNETLSRNLSGLLGKMDRIEAYGRRDKLLTNKIDQYTGKTLLLNLLYRILPKGTTVSQLSVAGNVVEMKGAAPKATLVLSTLSNEASIKNARFISPLRQQPNGGGEIFSLTFRYMPESK